MSTPTASASPKSFRTRRPCARLPRTPSIARPLAWHPLAFPTAFIAAFFTAPLMGSLARLFVLQRPLPPLCPPGQRRSCRLQSHPSLPVLHASQVHASPPSRHPHITTKCTRWVRGARNIVCFGEARQRCVRARAHTLQVYVNEWRWCHLALVAFVQCVFGLATVGVARVTWTSVECVEFSVLP